MHVQKILGMVLWNTCMTLVWSNAYIIVMPFMLFTSIGLCLCVCMTCIQLHMLHRWICMVQWHVCKMSICIFMVQWHQGMVSKGAMVHCMAQGSKKSTWCKGFYVIFYGFKCMMPTRLWPSWLICRYPCCKSQRVHNISCTMRWSNLWSLGSQYDPWLYGLCGAYW